MTRTVAGARWREDESLIETVTHLTEWPSVVLGSFDPAYLRLPEEVLVTVMRDHQKYFALEGADGRLLPHFLAVLNTETDAAGEAVIRHGNERVLRARFNDAQFFWDFDAKTPMEARTALLEKVTFQKDLGSYAAKTERTLGIAAALARLVSERGRRGGWGSARAGGAPGQGRPDDRTGEGVYGAAGHCRWAVPAGAAGGRERGCGRWRGCSFECECECRACGEGDLLAVPARIGFRTRCRRRPRDSCWGSRTGWAPSRTCLPWD